MALNDPSPMARRVLRFDKDVVHRRNQERPPALDEVGQALSMIFAENNALFEAIYGLVRENNLRAAGILLRSLLESTANAHWITFKDSKSRASKYCHAVEAFSMYMAQIAPELIGHQEQIRLLPNVAAWTTSSTEDRIKHLGPYTLFIWDYCSRFTHTGPAFYSHEDTSGKSLELVWFITNQTVSYALTARMIIAQSESGFFTKKESERLVQMSTDYLQR
jgi:hypothetical protein